LHPYYFAFTDVIKNIIDPIKSIATQSPLFRNIGMTGLKRKATPLNISTPALNFDLDSLYAIKIEAIQITHRKKI
jgi:hypothetical protein